jgi:cytochrome c-type biogenesis protein CcmH
MESNLSWATLFLLAIVCAGLIVYSFWHWTRRGRQSVRRSILIGLAILVAAIPAALKLTLTGSARSDVLAQQDEAALEAFISKQGGWPGEAGEADNGSAPAQSGRPDMSLEAVTAGLKKKLEANPDDVNGWILLGRSYAALGNRERAKATFQQSIAKWPDNADVKVAYAESLMTAAGGRVTEDARKAFASALTADPSNVRARFNLALCEFQNGNARQAQDAWLKLAGDLPPDSPWRLEIQSNLNASSAKLGVPAPKVVASTTSIPTPERGPTQADMAAAQSMSPSERAAFIDNMVDSLKLRLAANPNDRDGWLRLGRSYDVLGRWSEAGTAYENGLTYFPGDPELGAGLSAARSKS